MVEKSRPHGGKVEELKYSYSMKGHMDPDYGGKVEELKYSYSMKGHMDPDSGGKVEAPDYGGKVEELKYSYSMKDTWTQTMVERWRSLNTPIL